MKKNKNALDQLIQDSTVLRKLIGKQNEWELPIFIKRIESEYTPGESWGELIYNLEKWIVLEFLPLFPELKAIDLVPLGVLWNPKGLGYKFLSFNIKRESEKSAVVNFRLMSSYPGRIQITFLDNEGGYELCEAMQKNQGLKDFDLFEKGLFLPLKKLSGFESIIEAHNWVMNNEFFYQPKWDRFVDGIDLSSTGGFSEKDTED